VFIEDGQCLQPHGFGGEADEASVDHLSTLACEPPHI
jgi:hypothetical protein